jgi:hypothetical protein
MSANTSLQCRHTAGDGLGVPLEVPLDGPVLRFMHRICFYFLLILFLPFRFVMILHSSDISSPLCNSFFTPPRKRAGVSTILVAQPTPALLLLLLLFVVAPLRPATQLPSSIPPPHPTTPVPGLSKISTQASPRAPTSWTLLLLQWPSIGVACAASTTTVVVNVNTASVEVVPQNDGLGPDNATYILVLMQTGVTVMCNGTLYGVVIYAAPVIGVSGLAFNASSGCEVGAGGVITVAAAYQQGVPPPVAAHAQLPSGTVFLSRLSFMNATVLGPIRMIGSWIGYSTIDIRNSTVAVADCSLDLMGLNSSSAVLGCLRPQRVGRRLDDHQQYHRRPRSRPQECVVAGSRSGGFVRRRGPISASRQS